MIRKPESDRGESSATSAFVNFIRLLTFVITCRCILSQFFRMPDAATTYSGCEGCEYSNSVLPRQYIQLVS